jgi:hypothetical protein
MRPSIKAGIAVGVATGAWMFAEYALGLHDDPDGGAGRWTGFLSLVFPVIGAWWLASKTGLASWTAAAREGLIFGGSGGLVSATAIYIYFSLVNPGFQLGGQAVDAGTQALAGWFGGLIFGLLFVLALYAFVGRGRQANG